MEFHHFPTQEIIRLAERKWIFNYIPKNKVWAELGVFRGHFSELIYLYAKPTQYYLVDPWTKLGTSFPFNSEYNNFKKLTTEFAREETKSKACFFTDCQYHIKEMFSQEFLSSLAEELDVVYLDSSHQYQDTLDELERIDKVLAADGFICGDDYHYSPAHRHHGVFRAIHEFIRKYAYQIIAAGPGKQWILQRTPQYEK